MGGAGCHPRIPETPHPLPLIEGQGHPRDWMDLILETKTPAGVSLQEQRLSHPDPAGV